MAILSSDIFKLFGDIKCTNFPYKDKNGNYNWKYELKNRFHSEYLYHKYFDYWKFYLDKIVLIERIVRSYKELSLYDREIIDYLDRIIRHRRKFIRKIYKLGIIDLYAYNLFLNTNNPLLYSEIMELNLLREKSKYLPVFREKKDPIHVLVAHLEKK
jgi:hypothetical protein